MSNYEKVKLSERIKKLWINEFIRNEYEELTPDNFQDRFGEYLVRENRNWILDEDYYDLIKKLAEKLNTLKMKEE